MTYAEVNGIRLYYEAHGKGPAVVLAHGRSGNTLSWWQQIPVLARRRTVVAFDHRGFGRSADLPGGPGRKAFVDDLRALLDHLGIRRTALVAQSMGGLTCLGFALRHPERSSALVMADTSGGIAEPEILEIYRRKRQPPADPVERALGPTFRKRAPEGAYLYRQILAMNPPPPESLESVLMSEDGPRREQLAQLKVPTLFLMGAEDQTVNAQIARSCAKLIPGARLKIVPRAGHSVYFEQPKVFNRLVEGFLKGKK